MTIFYIFLAIVAMFLFALCYCFRLYHDAHGRDVDAVQRGAEIVMKVLVSGGKIADFENRGEKVRSANIDDGFTSPLGYVGPQKDDERSLEEEIPGTILNRSEKFEDQMVGSKAYETLDKVMNDMTEKENSQKEE